MQPGTVMRRALVAGAAGGAAGSAVLLTLGEPQIRRALRVEDARHAAAGEHGDAMFSRGTQVFGGIVANVLVGVLLGAVFGVAFLLMRHHLRARTDFGRSIMLSALGFVALTLIPSLKYPANPPAVGDPDTIGSRTWGYLGMLAIGVLSLMAAWRTAEWIRKRNHHLAAQIGGAIVVLVLVLTVSMLVFPPAASVPADMPLDIIWRFRLASLGALLSIWSVMGIVFGWLCERTPRPARSTKAIPAQR